ncbi:MAG: hypothetical protein QOH68_2841 [Nocardioidaceae bacterium]|nr:hypothetical protein [Nocardioidaceae bacterium]
MTRARAAVLVLAGLTLAACGNVHPGAAAVVDDQTISMKSLDKSAKALCTLASANPQRTATISNADIRRQALSTLVSLVVARKLADEEGITPKPADYELTNDQEGQVAKAFPKEKNLGEINKLIEQSQELSAISLALGQKVTGQAPTAETADQIGAAGQAEITKAFKDNDVEFAPRFGLSNTSAKVITSTGSLSVTKAAEAKPDQLPAAQRCS